MIKCQNTDTIREAHIENINGAKYEVISNYIGSVSFIELLKQMLKRDLERNEDE